jgi:hypothetical protein
MTITPIGGSNTTATYTYNPSRRNEWLELVAPAAELAKQVAATEFVPNEMRNRPDVITACILFGAELGLGPMQSLAKVDIVKGRPAPRAEIARALALAAGHELWIDEQTNTRVVAKGHRRNSTHIFTVAWSMDDARKAGIAGNPAYAKYPRQMLLARATAELVRQMAPEVLGGITVFAEEAADTDTLDTPTTVHTQAPTTPPGTQKRSRKPKTPDPTPTAIEPGAPHPADEGFDRPTEAQTKMAMALFADIGIVERDDRIAATNALLSRPVTSWNDLDRNEASTVIDALNRVHEGGIVFNITDQGVWETIATPGDDDDLLDQEES